MAEEVMKEKTESRDYKMLYNLLLMIMEEHCTIEEARKELESNSEAFIEKVKKGI